MRVGRGHGPSPQRRPRDGVDLRLGCPSRRPSGAPGPSGRRQGLPSLRYVSNPGRPSLRFGTDVGAGLRTQGVLLVRTPTSPLFCGRSPDLPDVGHLELRTQTSGVRRPNIGSIL